MTELALMLGLKHSTTSPYNSKANGRVEVAHKSMQTMMRVYMEDHVEDWVTRSYDLVVGTFNVFWDLFQVLFSGFISGLEGWGVQVRVGFLSMF